MKKIVRLTESELKNIVEASVKRTINEGLVTEGMLNEGMMGSFAKKLALYLGIPVATVLAALADIGFGGPLSKGMEDQYQQAQQNSQAFQVDKDEMDRNTYLDGFNKDLKDNGVNTDNIKVGESRIRRAVMESIRSLMTELSDDTIDSASEKADEKIKKATKTFGPTSPAALHAKNQKDKFTDEYRKRRNNGNLAKVARMQQNRHDRQSGKRTYVNGVGWRTKKDND